MYTTFLVIYFLSNNKHDKLNINNDENWRRIVVAWPRMVEMWQLRPRDLKMAAWSNEWFVFCGL